MAGPVDIAAPGLREPSRRLSWRETWIAWRNRAIANAGFRRWATRFPLSRPFARRDARALFDLVGGFVYSQVLSACVEVGLCDLLAGGPMTIATIAPRIAMSERAAETLVKAAAALELAEHLPDGRFALGRLGAALRGNPSVAAMIAHHRILYADLADPVALLRGRTDPALARYWAYAASGDPAAVPADSVAAYSTLMAESQALIADEVLDAYPLGRHRRLLDIGGGEGAFLAAAGERHPRLELMLFDLPAVAARGEARLAQRGLATRARTFGGSFLDQALPPGADVVSLVRVLHDHDDDSVRMILRAARAALPSGGTVLVAEPMSGTPGAAPIGDAYFGLYLTAMRSGRPRTAAELTAMLAEAGFRDVRPWSTHTPLIVRVLTATA